MRTLKHRIMFRVYCVYAWRKLRSPFVAESLAMGTLAFVLFVVVSVPHVVSNMLASPDAYRYFMFAFSSADHLVQALLVLTGCTTLYFAKTLVFQAGLKPRFA
jgi:formate/nitrite transporter FocA (FNT family)